MTHGPECIIYVVPAGVLAGMAGAAAMHGHWCVACSLSLVSAYVLYRGWRFNFG